MEIELVCGPRSVTAKLPERAQIVAPGGLSLKTAPVEDLAAAYLDALAKPLDRPPLREIVRPGWRVTLAFDDPTVLCYAPAWQTAIPLILAELEAGGVPPKRVTLLCANALHRKFTHDELAKVLGADLVAAHADRLVCHDAEDPDGLVHLGRTPEGWDVELNRRVVDDELTVYLNTATTRAFNGGWKSICVGLSSWRSIRWHHTPEVMSMSLNRNRMHEMLDAMGAVVDEALGAERIFKIETSMANPLQVGRVWAGSIAACRAEVLALERSQHGDRRDLVEEKVDVVLYGVPEWSPYAAFSAMNPLLTLSSTGLGYLGGVIEALGKPGCSVIMATPCPDRWNDATHPSYREVWDRVLGDTRDPHEIMERYEDEFASRPDYIHKYRHEHGFHPVHGLMATHPLKRLRHAGRIFVAGIEAPKLAYHLGFVATETIEDAVAQASEVHGADCSIGVVRYPPAFNRA